MEIRIERKYKRDTYTIGHLYIDGRYYCDTLEDKDRGLTSDMSEGDIIKAKVKGETAIPTGVYEVTLDVVSPRFASSSLYRFCGGKLPRLIGVKGYCGVLIHIGNTAKDTEGCILVGKNTAKGTVTDSTATFMPLYLTLKEARARGERITLYIE